MPISKMNLEELLDELKRLDEELESNSINSGDVQTYIESSSFYVGLKNDREAVRSTIEHAYGFNPDNLCTTA